MRYLKHFPKPLLDELVEGRWLPIAGAGLSRNGVLPGGTKMPLWSDLGRSLARLTDDPFVNPLDAISAYESAFDRRELVKRLSLELRADEVAPGRSHAAFGRIPFERVITTNLEFLLEMGYEVAGRRCEVVISEDQLPIPPRRGSTVLVKLHGDVRHPDRLVATEDDYDGFLARNPVLATHVSSLLIERVPVLIGYSLDDPDFRQLLVTLKDRLGKMMPPAYVIGIGLGKAAVSRFERRGVRVINLPGLLKNADQILADTFAEIEEHWSEHVLDQVDFTEEPPLEEVRSTPGGTDSRLCFFSVPLRLVPFYKDEVFPLAADAGLVPVSGFDLRADPGNQLAAVAALIQRSSFVVVDMGDGTGSTELGLALRSVPPDNVLVVSAHPGPPPGADPALRFIPRPEAVDQGDDRFFSGLRAWLRARSPDYDPGFNARVFLEAGQWSAAVVAAGAELERLLRPYSEGQSGAERTGRRWTGPSRTLRSPELEIDAELRDRLINLWSRRSEVVHAASAVSKAEAIEMVDAVEELRARL